MAEIITKTGDCLEVIDQVEQNSFDLIYLDPPFFTQKTHVLATRSGEQTFSFSDMWASQEEYACFLYERLKKLHTLLASTGSLFFHCDSSAAHIARMVLDRVFGAERFQSEVIWTYRRWSNGSKGLLPAHQNILWYTKTDDFKFFPQFGDYSPTTNIDQITQRRVRDARNKAVYERDIQGNVVSNGAKQGVPLSDVWDIPYLNPKAKERVGYPTQKPILLLEKILHLCTERGDWVLDPFCGSGTTLVTAQLEGRNAVGIDVAQEAIDLTLQRLEQPFKTESAVLKRGRAEYMRPNDIVQIHLQGLEYHLVQRNRGMDAILKQEIGGKPVFVRVQRHGEKASDAAHALRSTAQTKGEAHLVLILVEENELSLGLELSLGVTVIRSTALSIKDALCSREE